MEARYWHLLDNGRIACDLCPRACALTDGQRGLCFVRQRRGEALHLTTFGRTTGFCIDPIEKKPLNHFHPGTPTLSFGTAGCNLACRFCQNWHMSKAQPTDDAGVFASPGQIAQAAERTGCRSVSFTYNDPVIFLEYAVETAKACAARGIRRVAVTAGYISPAPREEFFRHMDAANVDLKGFSERFYRRLCSGHLQPVLETLVYLRRETQVWLEVTTLLIPGENDSDAELDAMTGWMAEHLGPDVPLHFTAFHPDWKLRGVAPTASATLTRARRIARSNGLRHVFTGNVRDVEGGSTYCHGCGRVVIERAAWEISRWHLQPGGVCSFCGTTCAGVFDPVPGNWGSKRMPLRIG